MQFQYIPLLNLPQNLRKRIQTAKNIWKWSFFVGLSNPGCWTRSENKLKSIRQATMCGTIIIPCNSNINHFLTCPKISGNCPKRLKILKKKIFHKFEHFSQPTSIIKQKNNCARSSMWLLCLFLPTVILIKRIGHENKCGTITIFYNSNRYSLICSKTWKKCPKLQKFKKKIIS